MNVKKLKILIPVFILVIILLAIISRTTEIKVTYYGTELGAGATTMNSIAVPQVAKGGMLRKSASPMMEMAYDGAIDNDMGSNERYIESHYYKVETEKFDDSIDDITKTIKDLKGTIKNNDTRSTIRREYDREYNPRYQYIVFTVDNSETNTEEIEKSLKKYGDIRTSEDTKSSVEQEAVDMKNRIAELEASLEQLKTNPRSATEAGRVAGEIEQYKNRLSGLEKKVTYKTYTIDVYEVIKVRINSLIYWYSNNYIIKNYVDTIIAVTLGIILIGGVSLVLLTIFLLILVKVVFNKNKEFKHKVEIIKQELPEKDINLNIKL